MSILGVTIRRAVSGAADTGPDAVTGAVDTLACKCNGAEDGIENAASAASAAAAASTGADKKMVAGGFGK